MAAFFLPAGACAGGQADGNGICNGDSRNEEYYTMGPVKLSACLILFNLAGVFQRLEL